MMNTISLTIQNTRPQDALGVSKVVSAAYGHAWDDFIVSSSSMQAGNIKQQIEQFSEGQFVALIDGMPVGMAATMRTNRPPTAKPLSWLQMIGGLDVLRHESVGEWLYGVEFAVHPDYRKHGIGTRLYQARFEMIKGLNLRGFYAVGMLMGYHRYRHLMPVREYGEKVMRREITDPTVTMQMNRGFRPLAVVEDYLYEEPAGNAGILILWSNPEYQEQHRIVEEQRLA
jgi:GNAT superfamily N-acetyltransferase